MPPKKTAPNSTISTTTTHRDAPLHRAPAPAAARLLQRAQTDGVSLTAQEVLHLQRMVGNRAVLQLMAGAFHTTDVPRPNSTGVPNSLKSGIESGSGLSPDDVNIHHNSDQPTPIGRQEPQVPHEARHSVQQKQGRAPDTLSPAQPPAQPVVQGFFDGLPTPDEVFRLALKKGLSLPRIQVLQWAATNFRPFGKLDFYLDNPTHIDRVLFPLSPAYTPKEDMKDENPSPQEKRKGNEGNDKRPIKRMELEISPSKPLSFPKVEGLPLLLDDEPVRGTLDIVEDSEEELEEFEIGLNEADYNIFELTELNMLLLRRKAPHDKQRRAILHEFINTKVFDEEQQEYDNEEELITYSIRQEERTLKQEGELDFSSDESSESDIEEPKLTEAYFEEPYLQGSEDESHSGTDTEGSDTEDEKHYTGSEPRQKQTNSRLEREKTLLKPKLVLERLTGVRSKEEQKRRQAMFKGESKREKKDTEDEKQPKKNSKASKEKPKKKVRVRKEKEKYYRKESKFNHPAVKVGDRAKLPGEPTKQQIQDMAQLNVLLSLGVPPTTAAQLIESKFVVAQYRGLFYSRSGFTHDTRAQHRNLDETDRPIFSSSVLTEGPLGVEGYYYLYNELEREEDLELYQQQLMLEGQRIKQKLLALRKQPVTKEIKEGAPRSTALFKPQTMSDVSTHFYSEDYDGYHNLLSNTLDAKSEEKKPTLAPLVEGLPNSSNPKVSTGDVPTHAARYAYGLKPYKGNEENILEPTYGEDGKPRHPYSGKMYVSVHPLSDYDEDTGPSPLVPLQNEGRINIGKVIIPERESQFEGMIEGNRVKRQMKAKFPDFSKPYKPGHADRYGLTPELFTAFKLALAETTSGTTERVFVEALLSNYLALHSELRAIEAAIEEAAKQGATLVYRTGLRSFGFEPPAILNKSATKSKSKPKATKLPSLEETLTLIVKKALSFKSEESVSSFRIPAPETLVQDVQQQYGTIDKIAGHDIACFIRSLVTAAARVYGVIKENQIEKIVLAITDHLTNVQLRTRGQMVDAGGLVGAEVRRVLQELTGGVFDPAVHVVMWDDSLGQITDFVVNQGAHAVWLFYTPGHFDLIKR